MIPFLVGLDPPHDRPGTGLDAVSTWVASIVRSRWTMRPTRALIRSHASIAPKALSLMLVLMCRATLDGVSKRVWAISSRIVLSRS